MGKGSPVASTAWHFPDVFRQISVEQWRAALHNSCARLGDSAQLEPSSSETTQGGANPYSEVIVAARSSLKGYLKFSLVSLQVKAYPATTSDGGSVKLNQLHIDCHSRINYKKTCPNHGEVSNDAIVSGYEYQKGQYVIVDTDELEKLDVCAPPITEPGEYRAMSKALSRPEAMRVCKELTELEPGVWSAATKKSVNWTEPDHPI
jgi:hypothetical protein